MGVSNFYYILFIDSKKKSNITISDIKDLEKYVIGTVKADASEKIIVDQLGSDKNIYSTVSSKAAFGMLMKGRVQLIAYISSSFDKLIIENGYKTVDFEEVMSLGKREICFAFSKNIDTAVINKFQKELQKVIKHSQFEFFTNTYSNFSIKVAVYFYSPQFYILLINFR